MPSRGRDGSNENFESEHDVDDCEFVHVYFHELIDMSSVKLT